MDFRTKIELPKPSFTIDHNEQLLLMGSCFAENIGVRLAQHKFNVTSNPFGILYNPQSIAQSLVRLLENRPITPDELFYHTGRWNSFLHHSRFSHHDKGEALTLMNSAFNSGVHAVRTASSLLVTWGTSHVYYNKESKHVVSNCHKLPEAAFHRIRLTVDEIVATWSSLVVQLQTVNPSLKILFTVSPIRHLRDGAHGNQLSKSVLLLAIDELCNKYPSVCHYFPSYEILLDELRDYRFFDADMVHPSTVAIDYIWQQFSNLYFSQASKTICTEWIKLDKLLSHRPLTTDVDVYNNFIKQNIVKLCTFHEKYPYIHLKEELTRLESSFK